MPPAVPCAGPASLPHMSPVSRGRRPKKGGKRKPKKNRTEAARLPAEPRTAPITEFAGAWGGRQRPAWVDPAIDRVLTGATALTEARNARELDQRVAELLGAQLHAALQTGQGLWFARWFDELVDATVERVEKGDHPDPEAAVRLLHGLAAHGVELAPELLHRARHTVRDVPEWLAGLARIRATGEVRRLRDAYGTRFGVIAAYVVPDVAHAGWYLWDIDASSFVLLVDAGVFDDPEQAAAAWRARAGDPDAVLAPVEDSADLRSLAELDAGEETMLRGDEPRRVMDNWFRARARLDELARVLRTRGRPLPARDSLYHDLDPTVLTAPFTEWHVRTRGGEPDPEVVEALAAEWMEGSLPETWFSVSPARLRFQHELISDWIDDPVTHGVIALMPEWARWLGERAGLDPERMQAVLDAARKPEGETAVSEAAGPGAAAAP